MPVAATFAFARDDGATLGDLARLDTMVTVVDAANFLAELVGGNELAERGLDQYEDDERTVSDPLMNQIGFADVIVLNELDLVGAASADRLRATLDHSGQVDVVRERNGERLYRPRPADGHRHYLVCRDCGLSTEVEADTVERGAEEVAEVMGFAEVEHAVELSGVCDQCRFTRNTAPSPTDRSA
nr:GTP-binding protein [Streptomyces prasinus]